MEQKKVVISPDTKRDKRIPPGQSETTSFPILHYGQMPTVDIEKWRFSIFGLVDEEKSFSYEEFSGLPMTKSGATSTASPAGQGWTTFSRVCLRL